MACVSTAEGESSGQPGFSGVAKALREAMGFQHSPEEEAWREPYLAAALTARGDGVGGGANGGAGDVHGEAIEYALSEEQPSATHLPPPWHPDIPSTPERPAGLTSREVEVLGLIATGVTSAQIAAELFLSPRTVEAHLASIYHKLGVTSRAGATRFALEHGLA